MAGIAARHINLASHPALASLGIGMRSLVLVALLVAAASAEMGSFGPILGGLMQTRVFAHQARLKGMEAAVSKLEDTVEHAIHMGRDVHLKSLHNLAERVHKLEGTGCGADEFQCGDDAHHCISDLLVCDHHNDCDNGHDEDKDVCDDPVNAGASFSGNIHFSHCFKSPDFEIRLFITNTRTYDFFSSRTHVTATLVTNGRVGGEDFTYSSSGEYNFGQRTLVIHPKKGSFDGLELDCTFSEFDHDHAFCELREEVTQQVCGKMHMNRN